MQGSSAPDLTPCVRSLRSVVSTWDWKAAPAECAYLFHKRTEQYLLHVVRLHDKAKGGILGRVEHYVRRYEVQERGSVHAHLLLWLHNDDVDRICRDIIACVPAEYAGESSPSCSFEAPDNWHQPADEHERKLFHHVLRKQLHKCKDTGHKGCRADGHCRYGFPWPPHHEATPVLNANGTRHNYFRPGWEHRNVVPYIAALALSWGPAPAPAAAAATPGSPTHFAAHTAATLAPVPRRQKLLLASFAGVSMADLNATYTNGDFNARLHEARAETAAFEAANRGKRPVSGALPLHLHTPPCCRRKRLHACTTCHCSTTPKRLLLRLPRSTQPRPQLRRSEQPLQHCCAPMLNRCR